MVSIVENTDADWPFGNGEAQFRTGKLGAPKKPAAGQKKRGP
jgi:hypothetical protein